MKPSRLPVHCSSLYRTLTNYEHASDPKLVNKALSGKDNFEKDFEKSHIKTNLFQKILLGLGSGFVSITSPSRGDMIAVMGEVTGFQALKHMQMKMNESEEGRKILEDKPRISSGSLDLEKFKSYPEGTLGKAYSNFLEKYSYTPDTRNSVQFVDDIELAYIAQRYRETHDLIHTLLDMPTNMLGEVTVKWVEAIQFKLPMCATGALFGAVRLAPKLTRAYSTRQIIKLDSSLIEKIESKIVKPKHHPGIMDLPRVCIPKNILDTIKNILLNAGGLSKLVKDAEVIRKYIRNRILPIEPPEITRLYKHYYNMFREQLPEDVEETEKLKSELDGKVKKRLSTIVNHWHPINFNKKTCLKYLIARAPAEYAALKRVFNEIRQRDKEFAPRSLLDFGSGVGTVNWAAHEFWGSTLQEFYCVDSSGDMNELAALILKMNSVDNEPFIRNVYYRQFFPATPRPFDIVVSAYTFFELSNREQRMRMLTALWNDTNEYLVLIEIGTNWGFQIITEARDFLLWKSNNVDIDCHVFAPCPHDLDCPRLVAEGKKTPCNFQIKYKTLSFSKGDDTASETFCFVIFRKKPKPTENERPCRIVRNVSRSSKLAVCKLCTTKGKLLDLFVTTSKHGKAAYLCAKASQWGDLIPGPLQTKLIEAPSYKEVISGQDNAELISDSDSDSSSGGDSSSDSDSESNDYNTSNNVDNNSNNFDKK